MRKKMTDDNIQKAEDRRIVQKLAADQVLTEEEDKRLDVLMNIAANKLGMKWPLPKIAITSSEELQDES